MLKCKVCGANLLTGGSVVFWSFLPERASAHLALGRDGVTVLLDAIGSGEGPTVLIQCSNCGEYLDENVEEVILDPEVEVEEN